MENQIFYSIDVDDDGNGEVQFDLIHDYRLRQQRKVMSFINT